MSRRYVKSLYNLKFCQLNLVAAFKLTENLAIYWYKDTLSNTAVDKVSLNCLHQELEDSK